MAYDYSKSFLSNNPSIMNISNPKTYYGDGNPFDGSTLEQMAMQASIYGSDMMRASAKEANETNIRLAQEAQKFNEQQAQKQMDFQERMSNTSHQREMKDLMAAGLNPILTATGGNGASSPGGTSANAVMAQVDPTVKTNPYEHLVSSTVSARRFNEIEKRQMNLSQKQYEISLAELEIAQKQLQLQGISLDDALKNSASQRALNSSHSYLFSEQGKSYAKENMFMPFYQAGGELMTYLADGIKNIFSDGATFAKTVNEAVNNGKQALSNLTSAPKRFWDYIAGNDIKDFSQVDVSKFRNNRNYGDEP